MSRTLGVIGARLAGPQTGVARYISNVLKVWEASRTAFDRIDVYGPTGGAGQVAIGPALPGLAWEQLVLPLRVRPDVLLCPSYTIPLTYRGKTAVVVHDALQAALPDEFPFRARYRFGWLYAQSARRADLVLADSHATKADIMRWYAVEPERIVVAPLGVDPVFHPVDPRPTLAHHGIPRPYVLFVGKFTRRRNVPALIEAFSRADDGSRALVIVGRETTNVQIDALRERFELGDRLIHLNWASDEDLAGLYSGADVVAYPSKREGFGLPVIEAMACGAPVLSTSTPAIAETATGVAILADGVQVADLVPPLKALLDNADLRRRMKAAGPERAARFRWDTCATITMRALEELAERP